MKQVKFQSINFYLNKNNEHVLVEMNLFDLCSQFYSQHSFELTNEFDIYNINVYQSLCLNLNYTKDK